MDKDKLKDWLATESHDREWLATQLGCSKGTVDQWFSRGFPDWATKSIERLMRPAGTADSSGFEVSFSAREFEQIEEARKLLGIASRKLFYEEAIAEYTAGILAREAKELTQSSKPIPFPERGLLTALVAEDPPTGTTADPYRAAAKDFLQKNSPASPPPAPGSAAAASHPRSRGTPPPKRAGK